MNGDIMQTRVLAASSSLSRRLWYFNQLRRYGFEAITADSGLSCIQHAATFQPHVLILEPFLNWGGSDGVLAVKQLDPTFKSVPVIVIDLQRDASETYRIGAYQLAGYWKWMPTADELSAAIHDALARHETPLAPSLATTASNSF